ncbi:hypothetical protein KIL84_000837 [Mauremys mutica]|uniref:Uncharacterized protein n=1 Tax=Mauremys mutica TaxID=74926 RepID=A0A9D3WXE8_9SAUR|nr:hypothetical protein KIL84_000837 [Mauremys mutica]
MSHSFKHWEHCSILRTGHRKKSSNSYTAPCLFGFVLKILCLVSTSKQQHCLKEAEKKIEHRSTGNFLKFDMVNLLDMRFCVCVYKKILYNVAEYFCFIILM